MKKSDDAVKIARYISEFLDVYAPNFLTTSEHTLKSYRNALGLYICFLETESVSPGNFSRHCFEREKIEKWIVWLKESRNCSSETCNVRLGSLRVFLEFLGSKDIEYLYLYQEAQKIKRQKCTKKKVSGFTRDAVTAMLAVPDVSTKTGKRDKIRTAYLLPKVVTYIKVYLDVFHDNPPDPEAYLFYSWVGGKHTKLSEPALAKRIKICAEAAHKKCPDVPLDAHAHQFRHAKASHWLEDGINVVQVSFLLGHEQLETTMRYLDITTEDKIKALATLEDKCQKTVPKKWKNRSGTLTDFCGLKK